jgi:hypothetical protein
MAFNVGTLLHKNERVNTTHEKVTTHSIPSNTKDLNVNELETLLNLIKNATFIGKDIEAVYNIVVKLQNQYLDQTK